MRKSGIFGIMNGHKTTSEAACNEPPRSDETPDQTGVPLMPNHRTPLPLAQIRSPIELRKAIPRDIKARVWFFTWGNCWYCGMPLNPFYDLCIDHVLPLSRGGSNEIENLVPACNICNLEKGARTIEEWRPHFWNGEFWFGNDGIVHQESRERVIAAFRQHGGRLS